jgi:hypothetical protein
VSLGGACQDCTLYETSSVAGPRRLKSAVAIPTDVTGPVANRGRMQHRSDYARQSLRVLREFDNPKRLGSSGCSVMAVD